MGFKVAQFHPIINTKDKLMDAELYILVPKIPDFSGFDYKVDMFSWGGVEYPQKPGRHVWGQHIEFFEDNITEFLVQILPAGSVSDNWKALCLRGHALDLLQIEVNGIEVDWGGRSLVEAIRQILLRSVRWVVVFALHNDQIDKFYTLDIEECLQLLRENLRWEANTEGFVVT